MATYTSVSKSVPSAQRSAQITAVAEGDQIDFEAVLGRPARKVQFVMTDTADTIDYKLNNLVRIHKKRSAEEAFSQMDRMHGVYDNALIEIWQQGAGWPSYSSTGSTVLETADGLNIASLQVDTLNLSSGLTITIVCW